MTEFYPSQPSPMDWAEEARAFSPKDGEAVASGRNLHLPFMQDRLKGDTMSSL
jgi:hypothetical protein